MFSATKLYNLTKYTNLETEAILRTNGGVGSGGRWRGIKNKYDRNGVVYLSYFELRNGFVVERRRVRNAFIMCM